jgi:hypothetical protein
MVDSVNVLRMGREREEIVASTLMIVILHGVCEATNDGFGNVLVLWLRRRHPIRDQVLLVNGTLRVKIHAARHVEQNHRIVITRFRSIIGVKRCWQDLLRVPIGQALDMTLIVVGKVLWRRFNCSQRQVEKNEQREQLACACHSRSGHIHFRDGIWLHPRLHAGSFSMVQDPIKPLLGWKEESQLVRKGKERGAHLYLHTLSTLE